MSLFASYERDFIAFIADINKKSAKIPDLAGGVSMHAHRARNQFRFIRLAEKQSEIASAERDYTEAEGQVATYSPCMHALRPRAD